MKSGLLYFFLVCVPIVGLLGILQVGERVTPPRYLGGDWSMEVKAPPGACLPLEGEPGPWKVSVSQSGVLLQLDLGEAHGPAAEARLRGDTLRVARMEAASACARHWSMEARVAGTGAGERWTGRWVPEGCPGCAPIPFVAARRSGAATGGR